MTRISCHLSSHNMMQAGDEMNLYFWLFSLCALLSAPVSITAVIRLGKKISHRTYIRIAGITFSKPSDGAKRKPGNAGKRLLGVDAQTLLALMRRGHIKRAMGVLRLEELRVRVRISFADAAFTAMS